MGEQGRGHGADKRDLEQGVNHGADQDRDDDGAGQVAARVLDLARELVGLLEAGVGEDDAGQRQRREQALHAARHEALTPGEKLPPLELEQQHDDGQDRDGHLPPGDDVVDPGEDSHGQKLTATKMAISTIVSTNPTPVTFVVFLS